MAKDIDEKIGARSQKNSHGLKYKIPLKNYRVHEMPTGDPALYRHRTIQALYIISQSAVRVNGSLTDWFSTCVGVRQGCIISPQLSKPNTGSCHAKCPL